MVRYSRYHGTHSTENVQYYVECSTRLGLSVFCQAIDFIYISVYGPVTFELFILPSLPPSTFITGLFKKRVESAMPPTAYGKRKFAIIDLTEDGDAASSSQAPRAPPMNGVSQSQRDTWLDQIDEADAEDIIVSSQDGDGTAMQSYQLYGILDTKIVGVQYYTGHATPGEYVVVRREPSNPYDPNALRVENVQRDQIGHIPRTMASKLAKYMVSTKIVIDLKVVTNLLASGFRRSIGGRNALWWLRLLRLPHFTQAVRYQRTCRTCKPEKPDEGG